MAKGLGKLKRGEEKGVREYLYILSK